MKETKISNTASLTAVWRYMGNVDSISIKEVPLYQKLVAYTLGLLDKASVRTITQRTKIIDSLIYKIKPRTIVEIGAGYSSRSKRFPHIKFYNLDLPEIAYNKKDVVSFDISKESLEIDVGKALFIVEGVAMYLNDNEVIKLLKEIKKYKGHLIIDFFDKEKSTRQKTIKENIYKLIFKLFIGKNHIFDFRIENLESGKMLLERFGYKNIKYYDYNLEKTLDCLFYAEFN